MYKEIKLVQLNITEIEFNNLMEEVDNVLKKENVPIHARTIRAMPIIGKRFKVNFLISPAHGITSRNVFTSYNMATHVDEWYQKKYGDRLKIRFGPGEVAILLKGDPWKIYLPEIYGQVRLVCDPDIEKYKNVPKIGVGGARPTLNIFNCVENITSAYAQTLSKEDMHYLMGFFNLSLSTLQRLRDIQGKTYLREALSDLNSAVSHIFCSPPHYGQSKWSSLQFIEKLFKCYLNSINMSVPRTHDLLTVAKIAENQGLKNIDFKILAHIECSPGIRYGEINATLDDAIRAHESSIKIAHALSIAIK
jgi:hypothetical protein